MSLGRRATILSVRPFNRSEASVYLVSLPVLYCGVIVMLLAEFAGNDGLWGIGGLLMVPPFITLLVLSIVLRVNFSRGRGPFGTYRQQKAWYALFFGLLVTEAAQTLRDSAD